MSRAISLTINGQPRTLTTAPDRSLLEVLREELQLIGTHYGCGEGACGACSVLLDDKRIFSCTTPVSEVQGKSITTIEGLATGDTLHPVQQAFLENNAFQCAYCTSGMIIAATALLKSNPQPTDEQIVAGMNGNICRCCTHTRIMSAIRRAAELSGKAAS